MLSQVSRSARVAAHTVGQRYPQLFTLDSFRAFAERQGAAQFLYQPGQRNVVAVFTKHQEGLCVASD